MATSTCTTCWKPATIPVNLLGSRCGHVQCWPCFEKLSFYWGRCCASTHEERDGSDCQPQDPVSVGFPEQQYCGAFIVGFSIQTKLLPASLRFLGMKNEDETRFYLHASNVPCTRCFLPDWGTGIPCTGCHRNFHRACLLQTDVCLDCVSSSSSSSGSEDDSDRKSPVEQLRSPCGVCHSESSTDDMVRCLGCNEYRHWKCLDEHHTATCAGCRLGGSPAKKAEEYQAVQLEAFLSRAIARLDDEAKPVVPDEPDLRSSSPVLGTPPPPPKRLFLRKRPSILRTSATVLSAGGDYHRWRKNQRKKKLSLVRQYTSASSSSSSSSRLLASNTEPLVSSDPPSLLPASAQLPDDRIFSSLLFDS